VIAHQAKADSPATRQIPRTFNSASTPLAAPASLPDVVSKQGHQRAMGRGLGGDEITFIDCGNLQAVTTTFPMGVAEAELAPLPRCLAGCCSVREPRSASWSAPTIFCGRPLSHLRPTWENARFGKGLAIRCKLGPLQVMHTGDWPFRASRVEAGPADTPRPQPRGPWVAIAPGPPCSGVARRSSCRGQGGSLELETQNRQAQFWSGFKRRQGTKPPPGWPCGLRLVDYLPRRSRFKPLNLKLRVDGWPQRRPPPRARSPGSGAGPVAARRAAFAAKVTPTGDTAMLRPPTSGQSASHMAGSASPC